MPPTGTLRGSLSNGDPFYRFQACTFQDGTVVALLFMEVFDDGLRGQRKRPMKKRVQKLHLRRETVQKLIADPNELQGVAAGDNSAGMICSRFMICTQSCGHVCP